MMTEIKNVRKEEKETLKFFEEVKEKNIQLEEILK